MKSGVPNLVIGESEKRGRKSCAFALLFMRTLCAACVMGVLCLSPFQAFSQQTGQPSPSETPDPPVLKEAIMCESLRDGSPVNVGMVFSLRIGRIVCVTSFGPASQRTAIYHKWFHRGQLTNNQRLWIYSPLWTAAGSIQLREVDKGPWQVEISDNSNRILKVLRFSIVD